LAYLKNYKNGNPVGEHKEFFHSLEKGGKQIKAIALYNNKGALHGEQKSFYANGDLLSSIHYEDGLLHGKKVIFQEDGSSIEEAFYQKGKLHGVLKQKDASGKEVRCTYVKNQKEGSFEIYYPLHQGYGIVKAVEAIHKDGVVDGDMKEFDEAGNLMKITHYNKGVKEGVFNKYFDDGSLRISQIFKNNELINN
jgi:antitoxin component YwqK of YwqJK toxin-antitoxin module